MDEKLLKATIRVLIDGQANLYAMFLALRNELYGQDATREQIEAWEDEWKGQTSELITQMVAANG